MKKKFWLFLLIIIVIGICSYNYIYKDHRDISKEASSFSSTSTILLDKFLNDAETAEATYLNKTITITGQVSNFSSTNITLNEAIFCSLLKKETNTIELNNTITIKGRCIGFDDLLEQVKLDQCTITN